jgi:hypothetical protein
MTRQDDGKDLLALWQDAVTDTDDPMRRLSEVMLQMLLEEEMNAHLNARPNERTDGRRGYRNGHYKRTLTTRVGKGGAFGSARQRRSVLHRAFRALSKKRESVCALTYGDVRERRFYKEGEEDYPEAMWRGYLEKSGLRAGEKSPASG